MGIRKMNYFFVFFLFAAMIGASGCSSVVDPVPPSPQPVMNVADYYLPLTNVGASYAYCVKTSTGADTILMTMQGRDANTAVMPSGQLCYSTDLTRSTYRLFSYYYSMNDSEAYTLGKISCGSPDQYWLDLKAPLMVGQTWKFNNNNGSSYVTSFYTAKVTRRGATMKMPDGTIYNDVAEIIYTSSAGDSTVKWFARGTGLLYSTTKQPNSDFGQEMRLVGVN